MPTEPIKPVIVSLPNKDALVKHLDNLKSKALESAGKAGENPYFFIEQKINPLRVKLDGEITPELAKEVLSLTCPGNYKV